MKQSLEIEKLRLSVYPKVMVDWYFGELKSGVLNFTDKFDADDAACMLQLNFLKDPFSHQSKVAINIANREAKKKAHGVLIDKADDYSVERVMALHFISLHDIDFRLHRRVEEL